MKTEIKRKKIQSIAARGDTPDTSALIDGLCPYLETHITIALEEFARKLERQRDEAMREAEAANNDFKNAQKIIDGVRREAETLRKDAMRWREVLNHIGVEYALTSGQKFLLRMPSVHNRNLLRGSVAEHFTEVIDEAMK